MQKEPAPKAKKSDETISPHVAAEKSTLRGLRPFRFLK
jgi:hypothetical protein